MAKAQLNGETLGTAREVLLAKILGGNFTPTVLVGEPGIGKTEMLVALEKDCNDMISEGKLAKFGYKNCKLVAINAAQIADVGDMTGIPRTNDKTHAVEWYRPDWFPHEEAEHEGETLYILLVDEFNRAQKEVSDSLLTLFSAKSMHTHKLPRATLLVAAMNPATVCGVNPVDAAMRSRGLFLEVAADSQDWAVWARRNKVHSDLVDWVLADPRMLCNPIEEGSYPCPRTLKYVSDMYTDGVVDLVPKEKVMRLVGGLIGSEAAASFLGFKDGNKKRPITAKEVFEDWSGVKEKVFNQETVLMHATIQDVVASLPDDKLTEKQKEVLDALVRGFVKKELQAAMLKALIVHKKNVVPDLLRKNKDLHKIILSLGKS